MTRETWSDVGRKMQYWLAESPSKVPALDASGSPSYINNLARRPFALSKQQSVDCDKYAPWRVLVVCGIWFPPP